MTYCLSGFYVCPRHSGLTTFLIVAYQEELQVGPTIWVGRLAAQSFNDFLNLSPAGILLPGLDCTQATVCTLEHKALSKESHKESSKKLLLKNRTKESLKRIGRSRRTTAQIKMVLRDCGLGFGAFLLIRVC